MKESLEQIKALAEALHEQTLANRRWIHAHPELSFEEYETARFVGEKLAEAGIAFEPIAGTGLLARIEGQGDLSRAVVLRADMDALPITERSGVAFSSQNEGVMHACGHDIHTAVLLSTLLLLNELRDHFQGTIFGLFQPGEEKAPGGASLVLAEDPFAGYEVVAFVGEHVGAEIPVGKFGFRSGQYMAATDEVHLVVRGVGGHAALPHLLKDPVQASAELILALQTLVREADSSLPMVLAIGKVEALGATNVIPNEVRLSGTMRTLSEPWRAQCYRRVREIAQSVDEKYGVTTEVNFGPGGYPSVLNNPSLTEQAIALAGELWGEDQVEHLALRMTGEDFGFYTERYPSLFYRLGVDPDGSSSGGGLHAPTFFPSEASLDQGVATMAALALHLSQEK